MAPRKKPPRERSKHFLREWRKYAGLNQDDAAERAAISRPNLSKIESGEVPYNQDILERLALAYGCEPGDLISFDPNAQPRLPIFGLPKGDADRVYDFVRALRATYEIPKDMVATSPIESSAKRSRRKAIT